MPGGYRTNHAIFCSFESQNSCLLRKTISSMLHYMVFLHFNFKPSQNVKYEIQNDNVIGITTSALNFLPCLDLTSKMVSPFSVVCNPLYFQSPLKFIYFFKSCCSQNFLRKPCKNCCVQTVASCSRDLMQRLCLHHIYCIQMRGHIFPPNIQFCAFSDVQHFAEI